MAEIPGIKQIQWWQRKSWSEALSSIPPIVVALVAAGAYFTDAQTNKLLSPDAYKSKIILGSALIGAVFWSIGAAVVRSLQGHQLDAEQKSKTDHEGLVGALTVIWNLVKTGPKSGKLEYGDLRLTVHRVVPAGPNEAGPEWFEQLVPYSGGGGGPAGRRTSIRSGIVGKAVREKKVISGKRPTANRDDYIRILCRDWSYTEADAKQLTEDRMSWMAVPFLDRTGAEVVAVLYLDSNDPNFFSQPVKNAILNASGGVGQYLQAKYGGSQ